MLPQASLWSTRRVLHLALRRVTGEPQRRNTHSPGFTCSDKQQRVKLRNNHCGVAKHSRIFPNACEQDRTRQMKAGPRLLQAAQTRPL